MGKIYKDGVLYSNTFDSAENVAYGTTNVKDALDSLNSNTSAIDVTDKITISYGSQQNRKKVYKIGKLVHMTLEITLASLSNNASITIANSSLKPTYVTALSCAVGYSNRPYIDAYITTDGNITLLNNSGSAISDKAYIISGTFIIS